MKRTALFGLVVSLAAGCEEAPAPVSKKQEPTPAEVASLQPRLQPPPQVVVAAPVASMSVPAAPARKPDANAMLAERVKQALEDESRIHAAAIDVTASAGTVTLWGTATSDDERARATRVAARIAGVKWVNNKLVIAAGS